MTRELLKQALEALQLCANGEDDVLLTREALSALREALEQPVQEPVRWMYDWKNDGLTVTDWVTSDKGEAYSKAHTNIRPLYTEPPKREWVGLTEGEMTQVANTAETYTESVKLTEAALKELNT